jgi:hypothetical protein
VIVRVREHDLLKFARSLALVVHCHDLTQLMDRREPRQALVLLGGVEKGMGEARRRRVELDDVSLSWLCGH